MNVIDTELPGVRIIEPRRFEDDRGWFMELYHAERYAAIGLPPFVQDNIARSKKGVLRGLHYQWPRPQGKLVFALEGAIFDVAVDIRRGSPTFAQWVGVELSAENRRQLWIPEGFAHGYCVLGEGALVAYKCTEVYVAEYDRAVRWDDPEIGVEWPLSHPSISKKDGAAERVSNTPPERLPA